MNRILLALVLISTTIAVTAKDSYSSFNNIDKKSAPLTFVENVGQVKDQNNQQRADIQFKVGAANGLSVFIGNGAIHYQFSKADSLASKPPKEEIVKIGYTSERATYTMSRMDVTLVGSNTSAKVITEGKQEYYENYYTDWSGEKGATAHTYNRITYKDVYPNIDWVFYMKEGQMKHEFVIRVGGHVGDIKLKYGGASVLTINRDGSLLAVTPHGTITENAPVSFDASGKTIESRFVLCDSILSYRTADYSGILTIDPGIIWATYYGGSADAKGTSVSTDGTGNVYMSGFTNDISAIATTGSYQVTNSGSDDVYLAKFDSSGSIQWATYYGGSGGDYCWGITTDGIGNVYLTGQTTSSTTIATTGAYKITYGGNNDAFLAKFNSSGVIQWATYYGGNDYDCSLGIASDGTGNMYIAGMTVSTSGIATTGAYKITYGGSYDAFLAKFNSSGAIQWATYYGGNNYEDGCAVATDGIGNVYLTGTTESSSTIATIGAHQTSFGGTQDAFLAKFNSSGAIQWATYYGGNSGDNSTGIASDTTGNVYIIGLTGSTTSIATTGAYQTSFGGSYDAFLAKFNSSGAIQWATYYGGSGTDCVYGVNTDRTGDIYIVGITNSTSSISTVGAYQSTFGGTQDALLAKFNSSGGIQWATYYGGSDYDRAQGVSTFGMGNIYVTGSTRSTSGIATTGSYQVYSGGNFDSYLAKFNICSLPSISPISGAESLCQGSITTLSDLLTGGNWTSSNTTIATTGSLTGVITGIAAGTATISYTVTNSCGSATATKTITINPLPTVGAITGSSSVCIGNNITLSDPTTGGTWSSSNAAIATVGSTGVVTGVTTGTATISYNVTNGCGTTSATYAITVNAVPLVSPISGLSSVCVGASITLTCSTLGGAWSVANSNSTVSGGVVTGVTAGLNTVTYSFTNTCGTTNVIKSITVNPLPNAGSISGLSSLCVGAATTLTDGVTGGSWSTSNANATVAAGVVTGVNAGTVTISYSVTNGCGTATATYPMTVNALPNAAFTGSSTVCAGSSIVMTPTLSGGSWTASNSRAVVSSGGVVYGMTSGADTITYSITTACGSASSNRVITVNPLPTAGTISGATSVCVGANITLTNATSGGTWSSSITGTATIGSTGMVTGVSAGSAVISYVVTNSCGAAVATFPITINPLPSAGSITGLSSVCVGSNITLTNVVTGGTWAATNPTAIVTSGGLVYGMTAGVDTIRYSVTNSCGTATSSKTVTVNPLPNAGAISGSSSVCIGGVATLTNSTTGGVWSATNARATVGSTGLVTGVTAGIDTIIYTVTNICGTATATRIITINPMPSAGTISGSSAVCTGSSIILSTSVTGGLWTITNANATVTSTGVVYGMIAGLDTVVYTVSNSCGTASTSKSITINAVPNAGTITGSSFVCLGGTAALTNPIAGGIWSATNGNASVSGGIVSGIALGMDTIIYTLTNTCGTASTNKIISIDPMPYAGVITGKDTVCIGSTISMTDTASGGVWSTVTGVASITTSGIVLGVGYGYDTVLYMVTNSCGSSVASFPIFVDQPGQCNVGIEIAPTGTMITVIPNPNKGMFTVKGILGSMSDEQVSIEVTNMVGQVIYKNQALKQNGLLDSQVQLNTVANGMYILSIRSGSDSKVFHIVVEQ
jgi:uncharacterized protein YjdB